MLTIQERQQICVLRAQNSSREAARVFNERYPERDRPLSHSTVNRIYNHWQDTGSLEDLPRTGRPSKTNDDNIVQNVLATVQENPQQSVRDISQTADICVKTARKILHAHHFHPYKPQVHQALTLLDPVARRNFCENMRVRLNADPNFMRHIMWSDEARFQCAGAFNRQNNR